MSNNDAFKDETTHEPALVSSEYQPEEYVIEPEVVEEIEPEYCDSSDVVDIPTETEEPFGKVDVKDDSVLSIDGSVVEKIVSTTCRKVDGVLQLKSNLIASLQEGFRGGDSRRGVSVEMTGEDSCTVNIAVVMEYGKSAPRIFQEIHDNVSVAVSSMTGLKVSAVNVRIVNVMTRSEMSNSRRSKSED